MEPNSISFNRNISPKGLIMLWAFAESGIGGVLHALKLPFTGIFVGGVAVISIALLAYYSGGRKNILKALAIVLLVKLTVSPHSPWQAYVAVLFQGYLGYLLFKSNTHYNLKCMVFSILCLLESAIQKILLALLIYGMQLMEAVDTAGITIIKAMGINANGSVVTFIFCTYIFTHLLVGIILGKWIPNIPEQIDLFADKIPIQEVNAHLSKPKYNNLKAIFAGFFIFILILSIIKILVPDLKILDLVFIFIRSFTISLGLLFVIGPFIKFAIMKYAKSRTLSMDNQELNAIIQDMPKFTDQAYTLFVWINKTYSGVTKFKNFILGLLLLSTKFKND